MVTKEQVYEALQECYDPEIPVNIVDLGLIYDVEINNDNVAVKMTLTAPGCGMGTMIAGCKAENYGARRRRRSHRRSRLGSTLEPEYDSRRGQTAPRHRLRRAAVESKHSAVKRSYSSGSSSIPVFDNERQTQDAPG